MIGVTVTKKALVQVPSVQLYANPIVHNDGVTQEIEIATNLS